MAHYSEILGEVVDDIRLRRRAGEKVSQIVAYLATLGLHLSQIAEYLDQAFCLPGDRPSLLVMPAEANGMPNADVLDRRFGSVVDKARPSCDSEVHVTFRPSSRSTRCGGAPPSMRQ